MIERGLSFTSAGLTLAGTLALPGGAGPFPALLLLQGSGPTDRNGDQPPGLITNLLKQIALALAEHGVASLRFDKRGLHANAQQFPADRDALSQFYSVDGQLADTEAAWRALSSETSIDRRRMGIVGHSEGGLYALLMAGQTASAGQIKSMILMASPGRSLAELLREQIATLARRQGAPPQQISDLVVAHDRIVAAIVDHGKLPDDVPGGLRPLYPAYLLVYLRGILPLDPARLATYAVPPTLILQGSADLQISVDRDAWRLLAALRHRPGVPAQLVLVEGASHNFKRVANPDDHAFGGPVIPYVHRTIIDWIERTL